jgi:ABC-type lipoprotein export system ATPase subunit
MSISPDLPLLRARGLSRRLGGRTVLHDIDLDLHEGEHLAVVGASGSGKSTLLHTLSGLEAPSAGTLHWAGEDLGALGEAERARHRLLEIGIVFQQFHLLRALTLFDNVVMPGLLARVRPRREVLARGRELMAVLGVESLAERGVGEASGGQLQRVAIARALINRPRLVVADEPTGALDTAASEGVIDALGDVVADGTALLVVTHDRAIAARASRIVTMADGRISGVETVAAPVA